MNKQGKIKEMEGKRTDTEIRILPHRRKKARLDTQPFTLMNSCIFVGTLPNNLRNKCVKHAGTRAKLTIY